MVNLSTYGLRDVIPGRDVLKWCFPTLDDGKPPEACLSQRLVSNVYTIMQGAGAHCVMNSSCLLSMALWMCISSLCRENVGMTEWMGMPGGANYEPVLNIYRVC